MLLLTPGPTPVPEAIRVAMSEPTIHHRTPEFEEIFGKTRELLKKFFDMPEVLMLASSGTGAMEASVLNLCKKKALVVNAGKFGERFSKICKAYGIEYQELKYEWDTPCHLDDVEDALKKDPNIDTICVQICESSGGLRHPVEAIAKLAKAQNPEISIIADGITAVGVEKIDTTHIDALISGSQKAFMLPPGLSMVGLSTHAIEKIQASPRGFYLNLAIELEKQQKNTTAWTAATTLVIGLRAILESIDHDGIEQLYANTAARAKATREALKRLGLKIYPKVPANSMSAVLDEDAAQIRKILKQKYHVNIAGGQEHIKTTLFRINHMGLFEGYETPWTLNAIELALDELGRRPYDGTANRIFCETLYK